MVGAEAGGILDGVRVLDLTRSLSGPRATAFLAGLGAEVIRIDEPSGDRAAPSPPFLAPHGVPSERPSPDDLGIAWPSLRARNARLVHCRIIGHGATGPDASEKAFDLMVQAATGLMSVTGDPGSPPSKTGSSLSDAPASDVLAPGFPPKVQRSAGRRRAGPGHRAAQQRRVRRAPRPDRGGSRRAAPTRRGVGRNR